MTPYPERCIITLSDMPNEPGRVQGVLGLDIEGTTAECTLVARGHSGQPRAMLFRDYPVCLEPLSALVIRLVALEEAEVHQVEPNGGVQYASLSIYRGPTIEESGLIEHLVAVCQPVTDELYSVQVNFADDLEERSTSALTWPFHSPWRLLEKAASCLWWEGGRPTGLKPLCEIPVQSGPTCARVREADIPAYARRRLLQHLGGFRGPSDADFFAEDWKIFLGSLQ